MAALALTLLLAMLWVAFVAFGYWHGGWRQVVLLAAMLLSYAVLSEWAAPNGHDLSVQFHWSITRTTTGVALLYLLVGTFVLGFLGSFALYRPRPLSMTERSLGAVMGILNGGLLLALVLRTLRSYSFAAGRGQTLRTSALSRFLIEDVGYLLLAALLLGGIAAMIGVVMARRDEAREMALLDAVATPAMVMPASLPLPEPSTGRPHPVPPPTVSRAAPPPAPVYATAPLIDWPANQPPGTRETPPVAPAPPVSAVPAGDAPDPAPSPPLPAEPWLPPRVPPPALFPVADLISAGQSRLARPVGPPPGVAYPAVVPPPASQEPASAEGAGEASLATPLEPPPPVVREIAVATRDIPPVKRDATPAPEGTAERAPPPLHAAPRGEASVVPAPIRTPPPVPRQPAPADETAKQRAGFARVAVARQPGSRTDGPTAPQTPRPSAPPEPLHPPLPTGPRVHPCATCGYPVRDHARYCPNCGSRQRP